jgi:hypothetical protein
MRAILCLPDEHKHVPCTNWCQHLLVLGVTRYRSWLRHLATNSESESLYGWESVSQYVRDPMISWNFFYLPNCRSQWPSGLGHELFSSAPTLRSWVRIPYRQGCLCVCSVWVFCVSTVSSETASRPNKRLMRTYHWISLFMSYIKSAN